jgi:hypothetical protein
MTRQIKTGTLHDRLPEINHPATEFHLMADEFPAVGKNMARILAGSPKILKINGSDLVHLDHHS